MITFSTDVHNGRYPTKRTINYYVVEKLPHGAFNYHSYLFSDLFYGFKPKMAKLNNFKCSRVNIDSLTVCAVVSTMRSCEKYKRYSFFVRYVKNSTCSMNKVFA